jgi:hypothetical protein
MSGKYPLIPLFILLTACAAAADPIRGLVAAETPLPVEAGVQQTVALALEEMAAIHPQGNLQFLEGIEIELLLSNTLKKYFDCFAVGMYKAVSPRPQKEQKSYQGETVLLQYLPYQNRVYFHIPIAGASPASAPAADAFRAEKPVRLAEFPLLLRIIPLAKGIPDPVSESQFYFTLKPIVANRGLFELKVLHPDSRRDSPAPYSVFFDEQPVGNPLEVREMEAGLHQLRIVSPDYQEVDAAFTVEPGRRSSMEILLVEAASSLTLDLPPGTEIFLDGNKLAVPPNQKVQLKEGEHLIRIKVGENSVSKKFSVKRGNHYQISVIFDIIILED